MNSAIIISEMAKALFREEREIKRLDGWFLMKESYKNHADETQGMSEVKRAAVLLRKAVEELPLSISRYAVFAGTQRDAFARSYALINPTFRVETFFRTYAISCGLPDTPQYGVLNTLAAEGWKNGSVLPVRTTFCGTRADPSVRGEITGIGEENLTPEALSAGVLYGIVTELYEMYRMMPVGTAAKVIASGNAVRKNPVLQEMIAEKFGMPVEVSGNTEEAVCGAAVLGYRVYRGK